MISFSGGLAPHFPWMCGRYRCEAGKYVRHGGTALRQSSHQDGVSDIDACKQRRPGGWGMASKRAGKVMILLKQKREQMPCILRKSPPNPWRDRRRRAIPGSGTRGAPPCGGWLRPMCGGRHPTRRCGCPTGWRTGRIWREAGAGDAGERDRLSVFEPHKGGAARGAARDAAAFRFRESLRAHFPAALIDRPPQCPQLRG